MLGKEINVIAFDVPSPPNYGGVVDIYYKLEAMHNAGIAIHLHCYQYGRSSAPELKKICKTVTYYPRRTFRNPFYGKLPYIVATRNSTAMIENLNKNDFPILFEGLHCCYYLAHESLKNRLKIVRTHNIEHDYYKNLEMVESSFFKKYFFRLESERLKKFENSFKQADIIAAISPNDYKYFDKHYKKVIYLPAFHPNNQVVSQTGHGKYLLYHGNLGVGENEEAAMFLIKNVFSVLEYPAIIAGNNPSLELKREIEQYPNITLNDKATSSQILSLIKNAQINVLPTFQSTGIKLKLINSLFIGRHCVVNDKMVKNTGLETLCAVANKPVDIIKTIKKLWKVDFTEADIAQREEVLIKGFSNAHNIKQIEELLVETESIVS
jgi:hypothetical protein